ncbi:MAG: NRDE family protein [bacterium]|nr:NRDE family protein [bacterium]
MCTLIIAKGVFPSYPLVVAANRDEHERPSSPPQWWNYPGKIYAPRDHKSGGTWIGVSEQGVFVAITNGDEVDDRKGSRSRGQLVTMCLTSITARAAANTVEQLSAMDYNGFHLVVADRDGAWLLWNDGSAMQRRPIEKGIHVISNEGFGPEHSPRAKTLTRLFTEYYDPAEDDLCGFFDRLLCAHGDDHVSATCHHPRPGHDWQTRSSMIVRADREWSRFETWSREGLPCKAPFTRAETVAISNVVDGRKDKLCVLVTAGSTLVPIDQVRGITNIFRGKTGGAIACEASARANGVTLLTSAAAPDWPDFDDLESVGGFGHSRGPEQRYVRYKTYDELATSMEREIRSEKYDVVIHSAAVSDYRVDRVTVGGSTVASDGKIGSSHDRLTLELVPTEKLVDKIRKPWGFKGILVKFKLEVGKSDEELLAIAKKSMQTSDADFMVANCLEWAKEYAYIVSRDGDVVRVTRAKLADELLRRIEHAHAYRHHR